MNKFVISIVIVAVVAIALGTAGIVYAQTATPQPPVPGTGHGYGMGGRGGQGGMMQSASGDQDGLLHDEMIAVYAEKLGISVEDLNTRLANGETMAEIATSEGLTPDEFSTLMTDARNQAIDQALTNGTLTQEQADWMKTRGAGMMANGRGMHGNGQGQSTNSDCPYYPTTP